VKHLVVFTVLFVTLFSAESFAEDFFVTIGGGPEPQSNQVSLESNVQFSQRVLDRVAIPLDRRKVFFADGRVGNPDLQYLDSGAEFTEAVEWMSRIYGDATSMRYRYRDHEIEKVSGPTRKAFLKQSFQILAGKLKPSDRLIVYVTAHGGGALDDEYDYYGNERADSNPHDTTIALWDDDSLTVSELDGWLNRFLPGVKVVLIMAQCHSGGFAHSIFHDASSKRGLNPQIRIGFFSQRHDRAAAGCTPEIDEREYQEYSTYFWEAMGGVTRGGEQIEPPDFNQDGLVSFAEAHAHAVIESDNIDIPITTSDAFLRKFSRFALPPDDDTEESQSGGGGLLGALFGSRETESKSTKEDGLVALGRDSKIEEVLKLARSDQAAIITRISSEMKVKQSDTVLKIRRRAKRFEEAAKKSTQLWAAAEGIVEGERRLLAENVSLKWPSLESYSISPRMTQLMTEEGETFVQYVKTLPGCDSVLQAKDRADNLEVKMDKAVNREAKLRRLVRTCENVLLEKNLPLYASESQRQHFTRMSNLEREGLPARPPSPR
jgi:hypothetical protein